MPPSVPNPATATSAPTAVVIANTAAPKITGIAQEGQILTLTKGSWLGGPTVKDQWESCVGATCAAVGTLNSLTYVPASTDVSHTIEVVETATYLVLPALTITSAAVGPIAPLTIPAATAPPTISGAAQQGQALTVAHGTWLNSPATITDQWEQCDVFGAACAPIPGQNGATYTLGPGDVGHTIAVLETAKNDNPTPGTAPSAATAPVTATSATSVQAFSIESPEDESDRHAYRDHLLELGQREPVRLGDVLQRVERDRRLQRQARERRSDRDGGLPRGLRGRRAADHRRLYAWPWLARRRLDERSDIDRDRP